jgi:hypothetical protein
VIDHLRYLIARLDEMESRQGGRAPADEDVVAEIVRLRGDGLSLRAIAAELNRREIPTPHGGQRWYASSVQSVLRRSV